MRWRSIAKWFKHSGPPDSRGVDWETFQPILQAVNRKRSELGDLNDGELQNLSRRLADNVRGGDLTEVRMVEAFALASEAAGRILSLSPFDVQIIGGLVMESGPDRRNANRGREDSGGHVARVLGCAERCGRPRFNR